MTTDTLLIPAHFLVGELLPWKGKYWKVQVHDPAGGEIQFQGETTGSMRAISQNPILVLEMQGDTTGEMKRRRGEEKRGITVSRKGFRVQRRKK